MLNPPTFDVDERSQAHRLETGPGTNPASRKSPPWRPSASLTRVLWASVGFMSFSGIAAARQAGEPAEEQGQLAGDREAVHAGRIEEAEAPESAVSSPPMAMDDPATPGPQGVELNFLGTLERAGQGRGTEGLLDANCGIGSSPRGSRRPGSSSRHTQPSGAASAGPNQKNPSHRSRSA